MGLCSSTRNDTIVSLSRNPKTISITDAVNNKNVIQRRKSTKLTDRRPDHPIHQVRSKTYIPTFDTYPENIDEDTSQHCIKETSLCRLEEIFIEEIFIEEISFEE